MSVYYNENDPFAAAWLRNLIAADQLPGGFVDERDIRDVAPDDLRGFVQHHFFAGIGIWARALADAGWPADRPIWTGSCPCQPFSEAGQGRGFADERHLWPSWHWLIEQQRPDTVIGEQVSSPDGRKWLDLVFADMEEGDYACGAIIAPAAGVGAPHARHRVYWMADADRWQRYWLTDGKGRLGDGQAAGRVEGHRGAAGDRPVGVMELTQGLGRIKRRPDARKNIRRPGGGGDAGGPWSDREWLYHTDGKYRPVEPGTFPLVDGYPQRVGRLRAYGNAIVREQAVAFIQSILDLHAIKGNHHGVTHGQHFSTR